MTGALVDELKHNEAFHANPLGEEPYTLPSQRPRKQMPEGVVSYPTAAEWDQHGKGFWGRSTLQAARVAHGPGPHGGRAALRAVRLRREDKSQF